MEKLTIEDLKKRDFAIDKQQKRAVLALNNEGTAAIIIDNDKDVTLNIEGMQARANIQTIDDIDRLIDLFKDTKIEYPF